MVARQYSALCAAVESGTVRRRPDLASGYEYAMNARWGRTICLLSSRRRHTRFDCDWSSDVCSSDLDRNAQVTRAHEAAQRSAVRFDRHPSELDGGEGGCERLHVAEDRRAGPGIDEQREDEIGRASCRERV